MADERGITMNEFKTVVESFRSDIKKMHEVMDHRFDKLEKDMHSVKEQIGSLREGQTELRTGQNALRKDVNDLRKDVNELRKDVTELQEGQGNLAQKVQTLQDGQIEIKGMLAQKIDRQEFARLEKRVVRLESKVA